MPACFKHWRQHAQEAGIDDIAGREELITDEFVRNVRAEIIRKKHEVMCVLNSQYFSHTQWITFDPKDARGKSEKKLVRDAVAKVVRGFLVNLTADLIAAKKYSGAFGSTIPAFQKILANRENKAANVVMELTLPILEGLSTAQLIEVRFKYDESFTRFQKRIREFLAECVHDGVTAPEPIREKMKSDLIDRDLEDLRKNLKDAEKSMKMKSAYAITLGTLVATVGVTTGIVTAPVAFGLAATISGGSLSPGVSKFIDDKTKVESHDLFFLLKAEAHAH
jgi:ribosome-binding factor A